MPLPHLLVVCLGFCLRDVNFTHDSKFTREPPTPTVPVHLPGMCARPYCGREEVFFVFFLFLRIPRIYQMLDEDTGNLGIKSRRVIPLSFCVLWSCAAFLSRTTRDMHGSGEPSRRRYFRAPRRCFASSGTEALNVHGMGGG